MPPDFAARLPAVKHVLVFIAAAAALFGGAVRADGVGDAIAAAAIERTRHHVTYDAAYEQLAYPMGDVAADRGVCSDVVVRSLRQIGLDLQALIHEDMRSAFSVYPARWGLTAPDANIDHRRVPNIETFLTRKELKLSPSHDPADYKPGDIVAWNLKGARGGFLAHVGIVTADIGPSGAPMVVHNIGAGPRKEDVLFAWPMTGRYRIGEGFVLAHAMSQG